MHQSWIHIIIGIVGIWICFIIWIKVSQRHQDAMRDVDPCRQKAGCTHCAQQQTCNQRDQA